MNNKLSKIVILNIVIVFFIMIFHEQMEALNSSLIYIILCVYAVINGYFVQRAENKERILKKEVDSKRRLAELAMSSVPSAIVIINSKGIIEYVNSSTKVILGSSDTVGENILEFDTVQNVHLDSLIKKAIHGQTESIQNLEYTSFTSGVTKILDVLVIPLEIDFNDLNRIMLFMTDVTYEHELIQRIEIQYLHMFKSFAKFIDAKDAYTGLHSVNVSKYVEMILSKMDIDPKEADEILIAANLHDIGKVGISDDILNKPGKLTPEEFDQIKLHPTIGYNLLCEIDGYECIAQMIKSHHERYDGKGYPDGISRDEIPLGAQIISVADAFDAITTNRVYRNVRSQTTALKILKEESNKQFSKEVVDIFTEALKAQKNNSI